MGRRSPSSEWVTTRLLSLSQGLNLLFQVIGSQSFVLAQGAGLFESLFVGGVRRSR